jgi:serine kinase of HPr protein (carbohydrate metabolism regulator)
MSHTVHGTAVLVGADGVLIRGGPGAGKSALAHALIERGSRLIGDDRVCLAARNGQLIATAPAAIAGLMELRGRGVVSVPRERFGIIRLVADIVSDEELERMPESDQMSVALLDIALPRQPIPTSTEFAIQLIRSALAAASTQRNMGLQSARV